MRTRVLAFAVLVALTAAFPAAAGEKSDKPAKPTLVVRVAPLDSLLADVRYLADVAGKGEQAEGAQNMLKTLAGGGKGLAGVETTKPLGLYGYLGPNGIDSELVVLLPVADEKAFLEKLGSFGLKPEKDGDVLKVEHERVPFPIYLVFANDYVYATVRDKDALAKDRLLDPAKVLAGAGVASAVINLDEIPKELKELALTQTELQLANAKDSDRPNETPAQKGFRVAVFDEVYSRIKELLNDGGTLSARLEIDRKAGDLSLSASLAGKPGSKLAEGIASLGALTSVAAGALGHDSAVEIALDAALPARLREALGPVIEEAFQQAIEKEKDAEKRKLAEPLLKVIAPTAKMGALDAGVSMRGPDAGGLYTVLLAAKIKDGKELERALKDALKESPVKEQGGLAIDFAKAGDVNIHKAIPDKVDDKTRKMFGDNPVFFAFRDDALLGAGGPGALEAIKSAATAGAAPGKIFRMEVAIARVAKLVENNKEAPAVAKRVLKGGDDTVRVTLEGGEALKLSLTMKAQLVRFFTELEEAKKAE